MKRILIKNIRANFALLTQETKGHRWNYLIRYMSDNRIRGLASLSFFPGGIGATTSGNPEVELGKEFSHPLFPLARSYAMGGNTMLNLLNGLGILQMQRVVS